MKAPQTGDGPLYTFIINWSLYTHVYICVYTTVSIYIYCHINNLYSLMLKPMYTQLGFQGWRGELPFTFNYLILIQNQVILTYFFCIPTYHYVSCTSVKPSSPCPLSQSPWTVWAFSQVCGGKSEKGLLRILHQKMILLNSIKSGAQE